MGHVHNNPWPQGAFFNYVVNILALIDHLPTPSWHFAKEFRYALLYGKIWIVLTFQKYHLIPTYLVLSTANVICERPPIQSLIYIFNIQKKWKFLSEQIFDD